MRAPDDQPLLELVKPWSVEEDGTVYETPIFALRKRRCASPTTPEKGGTFFYMDSRDWVNVVCLTPSNDVVLIEQFRHGLAEVTLELPGGMVDPGEGPLQAAIRELREETGYEGSEAELIGVVSPNPAIQNNRCHTALIRHAGLLHDQRLDGNEEIAVRLMPLSKIPGLIRQSIIHHALVVAAFHHLGLHGPVPG